METTKRKVTEMFPEAQVEECNYGNGKIPTRFERKMRWRTNFFVVVVAPWSYEIGVGRNEDEAWQDALKYVKACKD